MIDPAGPLEYRLRSRTGAATGIKMITRAEASVWIADRRVAYPGMEWSAEYRIDGGEWRTVVEADV